MTGTCAGVGPVRTCLGCRTQQERSSLHRLALVPFSGSFKVVRDHQKNLSGRGAWFCSSGCLALILKRRSLGRAFRISAELDMTELE